MARQGGVASTTALDGRRHSTCRAPAPRILLVRPDHLGDLILAGPSGRLLHAALPNSAVDWLVGPWGADVVRRSGAEHEILTCPFPGFTRRPKASPWSPYSLLAVEARSLRARRYDAALILRPDHWWGALLVAAAGIPVRIGFGVSEAEPFLTHALPAPEATHAVEANVALARLAAELLGSSALEIASPSPGVVVTADERAWATATVGRGTGPLIALHPGSGAAVKNWLPHRWSGVLAKLMDATGARVVLTGSRAEVPLVERIASTLEPRPLALIGHTSLGQLAALFEHCDLVLGGDSGPLHLAAAMGTPTVRLYGPTPTAVFGPWGDPARQRPIQAALPCEPCGSFTPPCGATATPACLRAIDVDTVVDAALKALATGARLQSRTGASVGPAARC